MDQTTVSFDYKKKNKNEHKWANKAAPKKTQHTDHNKLKNEHRSSSVPNMVTKGLVDLPQKNDHHSNYVRQDKMNSLYRPISPYEDGNNGHFPSYKELPMSFDEVFRHQHLAHYNNQAVIYGCFPPVTEDMLTFHENFSCYPTYGQFKYVQPGNPRHYKHNNYGQAKSRSGYQNTGMSLPQGNNREQRKRLKGYIKDSDDCDPIARRLHGLTNRLMSKAELMKVNPSPASLLSGGLYDQLSEAIYEKYTKNVQQVGTYEKKVELWRDLFSYVNKCISHYALYIVGSTMTGFGLNSSDIDMCLLLRPCSEDPRLDSLHQLHHIKNYLLKYGHVVYSELILAKVPILKLREEASGFEIDLNCNNSVGIYNTHLLYCYARCDWRVRPLVIMIKLWAQANRVNDAKNLTVSSYSWTLMLIQYLQCGVSPAVLPCLHTLCPDHFNKGHINDVHEDLKELNYFKSFNTQSLGELFIGFFGYYASFDFGQYAISVRTGAPVLIEDCKRVRSPKNSQNQWKYMCIEEPFDYTNTARSVYDIAAFRHIKLIITKSYEEVVKTLNLNDVLPVTITCDSIQ